MNINKKELINRFIKAIITIIIVTVFIMTNNYGIVTAATASKRINEIAIVNAPSNVYAFKKSKTSIRVKWSRVTNANGYIIYCKKPDSKKYKAIKRINSGKTTQFIHKKLKTDKIYKYQIKAFKKVNGKKKYGALSYWVSCKTTWKSKKDNVRAIYISDGNSEYIGKEFTLFMGRDSNAGYEYSIYSSPAKDPDDFFDYNVRALNSNGTVLNVKKRKRNIDFKAKGKDGSSSVKMIAHNGAKVVIKIKVSDYAHPKQFVNTDKIPQECRFTVTNYQKELSNVAAYFEKKNWISSITYASGKVVVTNSLPNGTENNANDLVAAILPDLEILFKNTNLKEINTWFPFIKFYFKPVNREQNMLFYGPDEDESTLYSPSFALNGMVRIAPLWRWHSYDYY
ncbi:MAG: fibronectin type III domain-containing protein [Anaerovoracaceae bacterium]